MGGVQAKTYTLYLDADRTGHSESALAIEYGMRVAFDEVNNQINGDKFEFVTLDHRGNSARSKHHMNLYDKDKNALAYVGGLHSPPLIKYRDFINQAEILTLVPWAAGGPITRYPSEENWVFRLSVDDRKAGERLAKAALGDAQCKKPALLLEETPWGQSNQLNISKALLSAGHGTPEVAWFNWGINDAAARTRVNTLLDKQADCIIMVANAMEGSRIINAVASLPVESRVPIISHWGITGGDMSGIAQTVNSESLTLHFIQTCFSFLSESQSALSRQVYSRAVTLFDEVTSDPASLDAPTGFIHGYDLGKVFISAVAQADLSGDIDVDRRRVRLSMEALTDPIDGLIKTYRTPFTAYSEQNPDAHEALGVDDLCMASLGPKGEIRLIEDK
nr:ABC transporter substrate-binding protein [Thaumasiovibrio subtropicus]